MANLQMQIAEFCSTGLVGECNGRARWETSGRGLCVNFPVLKEGILPRLVTKTINALCVVYYCTVLLNFWLHSIFFSWRLLWEYFNSSFQWNKAMCIKIIFLEFHWQSVKSKWSYYCVCFLLIWIRNQWRQILYVVC